VEDNSIVLLHRIEYENGCKLNLNLKDWVLIQRYVTGNATSEENRKVEQWMSRDPENNKLVREIKEIWDLTPEEHFDVNVQAAWKRFQSRRTRRKDAYESGQIFKPQHKPPRTIYHVFKAAAFILVGVVAGFFFQHISTVQSEAELAADRSQFYTLEELATDRGEKARVTFSDGTEVTLNSSSSIRFPQEFQDSAREVYLEGEAYFKVTSDPGQPFIVYANGINVEVLGTEFNVRGWSEDRSVDVIVREGRVSVSPADQTAQPVGEQTEVILTGGYYTRVESGENPLPAQKIDVVNRLLWMSGGMHFDNVPFRQVITDLERRFNVEITVSDEKLLEVPYTGTFQYAELEEILKVISASMEFEYSKERSSINFSTYQNVNLEE
jgi:transmembrane sensor